jgi:hypothetical protein
LYYLTSFCLSNACLLFAHQRRCNARAPPTVLHTFQQGSHWPKLSVHFLHSTMLLKWVEYTAVRKWVCQRARRTDCSYE